MPNGIAISCQIDTSKLSAGLNLCQEFTKRTPAESCNTAGLEIAIGAKNRMPVVPVPRIDTELAVLVSPVIGKRGLPLKNKKHFTATTGTARNPDVALAILIIQARARPGSAYNVLTNNRYALSASPFKGVSRAQGAAAMAVLVHEMIASRHSASAFLKAGWVPVVEKMRRYSVNKYRLGLLAIGFDPQYRGGDLGKATPATPGQALAICVIENDIGYEGLNAASFNHALWQYGAPGLQQSIDDEGVKAMQYYLDHAGKDLEKNFNAMQK